MSIEEKAKAEAKRLMSEVSRLQAKAQCDTQANKAGTDKLIAEINRLQMAAVKERDDGKVRQARQETKKLFEEQLAHIHARQINTREQMNRLMLAKQKYELALKNADGADDAQDRKTHQQMLQLIKRKKEEYLQLNREAETIQQRAAQKSIDLSSTTSRQGEKAASKPAADSPTDRAKAEAENLMSKVRDGAAPRGGGAGTADKAEEVGRMIAEISRLQTAADKGLLSDDEMAELEDRVHRIESKQRQTRDQINQLTQAKIKYELALSKSAAARDQERERREQDEKLQKELNDLIQNKEQEQSMLMQELHEIRMRSQQEAELLKAQRDAARALAEQQAEQETLAAKGAGGLKKSTVAVLVSIIVLLFISLLGLSYFVLPWRDWLREQPVNEMLAPEPALKKTPPPSLEAEPEARKKAAPEPPKTAPAPTKFLHKGFFQDKLRSGGRGPKMVRLPGGSFLMGAADESPYSDERPRFKATLSAFAISEMPVTFADYQLFVKATGAKMPDDRGWGGGRHPVINVTWQDANAYTEWLSEQTGSSYRLPSEREWEYAAKAGTLTDYWWGKEIGENNANCIGCGSQWDGRQTAQVGSFQPNPFGLYDMIGNVSEWTLTCFRPSYVNAPANVQIWEDEPDISCSRRVVRGSAYDTPAADTRVTRRTRFNPRARNRNLGFRVVRD